MTQSIMLLCLQLASVLLKKFIKQLASNIYTQADGFSLTIVKYFLLQVLHMVFCLVLSNFVQHCFICRRLDSFV
jgi:hypothetical protein